MTVQKKRVSQKEKLKQITQFRWLRKKQRKTEGKVARLSKEKLAERGRLFSGPEGDIWKENSETPKILAEGHDDKL